jgi:hypothetical protein
MASRQVTNVALSPGTLTPSNRYSRVRQIPGTNAAHRRPQYKSRRSRFKSRRS